jgi:hypothetical protein
MKILVQWPTRNRPVKFLKTLRIYQEFRKTDFVHFHIVIDEDDREMRKPEVMNVLKMWGNLSYEIAPAQGKIAACNYGLTALSKHYDIIVLASDDMIPVRPGWDARIIEDMSTNYPDGDGVLWYNDGKTGNTLNTLSILGTKYFRRFGYIYHPDYKALWCDNEFTEVADALGKQKYIEDVIIRHEHPIWGYGQQDELNNRDNRLYQDDKQTYLRRKGAGFGIEPTAIEYPDSDVEVKAGDVPTIDNGDRPTNKRKRGRPVSTGGKSLGRKATVNRGEKE